MKRMLAIMLVTMLAGCADDAVEEALDSDGDGYEDAVEEAAGSDPRNATSIPVAIQNETIWPAWGELESATIRPGSSLGGYCTFNFLFEGPNGTGYIGTAGHCTDGIGERLELSGVGDIATVVYDSDEHGSGVDFSLARIDPDKIATAHPKMLGWDGPTGAITTADLSQGDVVQLHGYGAVLGQNDVTRDRVGVLVDWNDDEYIVDMPAVPGDSGSPLLHASGKALGIISRFGFDQTPPSTDVGPMMPYIYRELATAGYGDVRLATI